MEATALMVEVVSMYAANTYFFTLFYVLDSGGILWVSAATALHITPAIVNYLILNINKYLTALPSTANFTTLAISSNTVATQS